MPRAVNVALSDRHDDAAPFGVLRWRPTHWSLESHDMAHRPAAAPKANDLVRQVAGIARSSVIDEVALRRIAREARALMKSDAAGAHAVLGTVAAIRGDEAATKKHYRIALDWEPQVPIWVNYATSLTMLDDNQGALDVLRKGMKAHPGDLTLAEQAIEAAIPSCNFRGTSELLEHHNKLAPDRPPKLGKVAQMLAEAVETGPMSEAGARKLIELMTTIQREGGARTVAGSIGFHGCTFVYERSVRCTPPAASSINWRLAGALAEGDDLWADPGRLLIGGFIGIVDDFGECSPGLRRT